MVFRMAADVVVLLHATFVVFVVLGGLLAIRWPRLAWVHLPAAIWGASIEIGGGLCPLTPLENMLRERAGGTRYGGDFIEHYLLPVLYPAGLTPDIQIWLGGLAIGVNVAVYLGVIWMRHSRGRAIDMGGPGHAT